MKKMFLLLGVIVIGAAAGFGANDGVKETVITGPMNTGQYYGNHRYWGPKRGYNHNYYRPSSAPVYYGSPYNNPFGGGMGSIPYGVNSYNNSYHDPYYYNQPIVSSGGINMGQMFRRFFSGVPTGYTPQVNPNAADADYYDMGGTGSNSNQYRTRKGWGYDQSNGGARTGVTILD